MEIRRPTFCYTILLYFFGGNKVPFKRLPQLPYPKAVFTWFLMTPDGSKSVFLKPSYFHMRRDYILCPVRLIRPSYRTDPHLVVEPSPYPIIADLGAGMLITQSLPLLPYQSFYLCPQVCFHLGLVCNALRDFQSILGSRLCCHRLTTENGNAVWNSKSVVVCISTSHTLVVFHASRFSANTERAGTLTSNKDILA